MGVLDDILAQKRSELAELRQRRLPAPPPRRPLDWSRSRTGRFHVLAELKRRSPSAGRFPTQLSLESRARAYEVGGASAISVLCDREFFDGDYAHLSEIRAAVELPLLCKEFVIDEVQLDCARAFGADAVLLIARCLSPDRLFELHQAALERELVPLVEVATPEEAAIVAQVTSPVVGVNARDLDSLKMDPERARQVLSLLTSATARLHLSGIREPAEVSALVSAGVDGALVGETLMRSEQPELILRALLAATLPESG